MLKYTAQSGVFGNGSIVSCYVMISMSVTLAPAVTSAGVVVWVVTANAFMASPHTRHGPRSQAHRPANSGRRPLPDRSARIQGAPNGPPLTFVLGPAYCLAGRFCPEVNLTCFITPVTMQVRHGERESCAATAVFTDRPARGTAPLRVGGVMRAQTIDNQ